MTHFLRFLNFFLTFITSVGACVFEGKRAESKLWRVHHSALESNTSRGNPWGDAPSLLGIPRPWDSQVRAVAAWHDRANAGTPAGKFPGCSAHRRPLQASVTSLTSAYITQLAEMISDLLKTFLLPEQILLWIWTRLFARRQKRQTDRQTDRQTNKQTMPTQSNNTKEMTKKRIKS